MSRSCERGDLPEDFSITISAVGQDFKLETRQTFPIAREKAFVFFEDPRNLFAITPGWLDFRMDDLQAGGTVYEGAEYDYHIRWCGLRLKWRSRIRAYAPPDSFTDIQLVGPYSKWEHTHSFLEKDGNTLMCDTVIYRLPCSFIGRAVQRLLVKDQLEDIFCYRAVKIREWVTASRAADIS